MDAYHRLAAELRQPAFLWRAQFAQALRAALTGRFAEAERRAEQARATGQQAQNPIAGLWFTLQLLTLRWHQGRLGELEAEIKGLVERLPRYRAGGPGWRCSTATWAARRRRGLSSNTLRATLSITYPKTSPGY